MERDEERGASWITKNFPTVEAAQQYIKNTNFLVEGLGLDFSFTTY